MLNLGITFTFTLLTFTSKWSNTPKFFKHFLKGKIKCVHHIGLSGILLAFFTIAPKYVGPCMLSPRRNALPNLSPTPRTSLHRHTLEFGNTTNLQHLKSRSFFCSDDIGCCVKRSCRNWVDKFSADHQRPSIPPVWRVKLGTNLTRLEILKFKILVFSSLKNNATPRLASLTHFFLPSTSLEWTFQPTQIFILLPSSPRL
jgi:hypothetical protein